MAMLQQNSIKKENKMREMYSSDNIFKKINEAREKEKIKEEDIEKAEESTIAVAKEEKGFFKRIFKK
jgi:transcriptional regulator NrdR family protein